MTGKEAIIHCLGMHKRFNALDVAATTGVTITSINQVTRESKFSPLMVCFR